MLEGGRTIFGRGSYEFQTRHLLVIAILAIAFSTAFIMRSYPAKYGFYLNEFDPYFDYRATKFIVDNGLDEYWKWHDYMSWYPEGRDIPSTSQSGLHVTAAILYKIFGGGTSLLNFTIIFPVVLGSLTVIVMFALVRVIRGTTAGLFAALLFAFSPAIIQRGNLGWFKSEPLGLFFGLLGLYLFLSAIRHREIKYSIPKAVVGGLALGLANAAWGGIQYFSIPIALFLIALPFFRKDLKVPMYAAIAFTAFTLLSVAGFPRPGMSFVLGLPGIALIGGTIFIIIATFLRRIGGPREQLRNTVFLLVAFLAVAVGVLAAGAYVSPSFRYFNALNPFLKSQIPLVESVAEHFTPTVADYFTDFSILIMFAGLGAWLAFRRRDDMGVFALILGFTGVYVSATFARLLVFASIGIIALSAMGLYEVTRSIMEYRALSSVSGPARKKERDRERENADQPKVRSTGTIVRVSYIVLIILMLSIPMVYPPNSGWLSAADIPPSIANGGTGYRLQTSDWLDALNWLAINATKNSVVASWWDYGYWITALGNKTTLADNATINQTRIQTIAKMLINEKERGIKVAQDLKADYILVYVVGQRLGSSGVTGSQLYTLGQGGDESKKQWFMRIGGFNERDYLESDGFTPKSSFWNGTLLGQLFPFSPVGGNSSYISQQGIPSAKYSPGSTALYNKDVKFPANGGENQPLRLVYSSPSFNSESRGIVFGVLIYEVNHNYVPKPVGNPYDPKDQPIPTESTTPPTPPPPSTNATLSNKTAIIDTTQGTIKIQFFADKAPKHVENFMKLANEGFYNGTVFHRIVPGFVIQAGDPNTRPNSTNGREAWGQGGPGYSIPAEFNDIPHARGIVSMARGGDPNSAGSQFFIVLKDSNFLDKNYSVFGKVVEGMDVVDKIAALQTNPQDQPVDADLARILSLKIVDNEK